MSGRKERPRPDLKKLVKMRKKAAEEWVPLVKELYELSLRANIRKEHQFSIYGLRIKQEVRKAYSVVRGYHLFPTGRYKVFKKGFIRNMLVLDFKCNNHSLEDVYVYKKGDWENKLHAGKVLLLDMINKIRMRKDKVAAAERAAKLDSEQQELMKSFDIKLGDYS